MRFASIALFTSLALAIVVAVLRIRISSVTKSSNPKEGPAPEAPIGDEVASITKEFRDDVSRFSFGGVEASKNNRAALRAEVEKLKGGPHGITEPQV